MPLARYAIAKSMAINKQRLEKIKALFPRLVGNGGDVPCATGLCSLGASVGMWQARQEVMHKAMHFRNLTDPVPFHLAGMPANRTCARLRLMPRKESLRCMRALEHV